jgi:uncharacterized OB-fold protein
MEERLFTDHSFEQFLAEEKLMGSKCRKCGTLYVPPRPICIQCGSTKMEWFETRGTGKLSAFTCISVGPPYMREEGYGRKRPYCTGVVELEEGPRVVARIEGVDAADPERLGIGTPLHMELLHRERNGQKRVFLAFRPV